ncbi:hypothetical protein GCM10008982_32900 [Anoxybacillus voinovskiensis]|nr:hypothetical protein GCM10008982_32900 [Anoxybacillus voinovskiensis]
MLSLIGTGIYYHQVPAATNAKEEAVTQNNSLGQIPSLVLPTPGQAGAVELNFKMNAPVNRLPNQVPVYKFKYVNYTNEEVRELANKLGILGSVKSNSQMNALAVEDGYKYLEVQNGTGKILYINREHYNLKEINGRPKNIPTDSEAIQYATEFLKKMNWLPSNFKVAGVTENREIPGNLNPETDKGYVLSKSVHFYQYIDNKPLLGVSRIVVEVGDNGKIEVVRKNHKEHVNFADYPIKSVNVAIDELKNNKGIHNVVEGGHDPVIDDVTVSYWEDAGTIEEQPYLQPVYVFKGNYTLNGKQVPFLGVVPAVENNFVLQKPMEQPAQQHHPEKNGK